MSQASPYLPVFLSTSSKKPAMTKEESEWALQMHSESNSFYIPNLCRKGKERKKKKRRECVPCTEHRLQAFSTSISKWYCWSPQFRGPWGRKESDSAERLNWQFCCLWSASKLDSSQLSQLIQDLPLRLPLGQHCPNPCLRPKGIIGYLSLEEAMCRLAVGKYLLNE